MGRILVLVVAVAVAGCQPRATTTGKAGGGGGGSDEPIRLDLRQVRQDLKDNRPGTLARYKGKVVEVDVAGVTIQGGDERSIVLGVKFKGEGEGVFRDLCFSYRGTFDFSADGNAQLKTIKAGVYSGRVRGVVESLEPIAFGDCNIVSLNPAWVVGTLAPAGAGP